MRILRRVPDTIRSVFTLRLYHNHDTKKAFEALEQAGYGGLKWIEARRKNQADNNSPKKVNSKSEPPPAPYGFNPYTGEVFDKRGYPADWDTVQPPEPGTDEYNEATLLIKRELGAEIDDTVTPEEISVFWQNSDAFNSTRNWRAS